MTYTAAVEILLRVSHQGAVNLQPIFADCIRILFVRVVRRFFRVLVEFAFSVVGDSLCRIGGKRNQEGGGPIIYLEHANLWDLKTFLPNTRSFYKMLGGCWAK